MANICRYCKNKLPDGAKRCPTCGRAVVNTCTYCGTRIYSDEKYCPGCGAPVLVNCPNCGEKIYSGERFCPYCGSKNERPHEAGTNPPAPQVNMPYPLPVVPPMPPMPPMGFGMPGMPPMFGGAPIMLPPISLAPAPAPAVPAPAPENFPAQTAEPAQDEKPERLLRTRPAPDDGEPEQQVVHEGVRTGSVGLLLALFSLFFFFPTVIMPVISLIVSAVGIRVDKKRGRGIAPGVIGLIIRIFILLALIALVVWGLFFGGWNFLVDNFFTKYVPGVAWPKL